MKKNKKITLVILFILIAFVVFNFYRKYDTGNRGKLELGQEELMKLVFLDVGQGDSNLIILPNDEVVMIDGGSRKYRERVLEMLDSMGIDKIDYLIATHPHEDHIGSLPDVIRNKEIGQIYMPKVSNNTKIFEDLLLAIKEKNLKIKEAKDGIIINEYLEILGPSKKHKDINNNSVVLKVTYKNIEALYTGDMEKQGEEDLIKNTRKLKADILKVGHHGSNTSTSDEFLKLVRPKYAIISVGEANKYKHPNEETISKLNEIEAEILRTDILGHIILETDGNFINLR